jgi:hypothetical protein
MKRIFVALMLALVPLPLAAHHSDTNYDVTTPFTLSGTVVEFRFINPHIQITLDVTDADGKVTKWVGQGTSPNMLVFRGWSRTSLKPGDKVTLNGNRAKNGLAAMKFSEVLIDGKPIGDWTPAAN